MRHLKKFVKTLGVNSTCIGFTNFLRCLIFDCYNISICKKEKIKDETSKKIHESNGGQWDILLLNLTCIGLTNFL